MLVPGLLNGTVHLCLPVQYTCSSLLKCRIERFVKDNLKENRFKSHKFFLQWMITGRDEREITIFYNWSAD